MDRTKRASLPINGTRIEIRMLPSDCSAQEKKVPYRQIVLSKNINSVSTVFFRCVRRNQWTGKMSVGFFQE